MYNWWFCGLPNSAMARHTGYPEDCCCKVANKLSFLVLVAAYLRNKSLKLKNSVSYHCHIFNFSGSSSWNRTLGNLREFGRRHSCCFYLFICLCIQQSNKNKILYWEIFLRPKPFWEERLIIKINWRAFVTIARNILYTVTVENIRKIYLHY